MGFSIGKLFGGNNSAGSENSEQSANGGINFLNTNPNNAESAAPALDVMQSTDSAMASPAVTQAVEPEVVESVAEDVTKTLGVSGDAVTVVPGDNVGDPHHATGSIEFVGGTPEVELGGDVKGVELPEDSAAK